MLKNIVNNLIEHKQSTLLVTKILKILIIIGLLNSACVSFTIANSGDHPSTTYDIVREIGKGDFEIGLEHIVTLARLGNGEATLLYANLFLEFGDFDNARKYLTLAAKQNSPTAIKFLGTSYFKGTFGVQNYEEARHWFEQRAALRNINSIVYLGIIYRDGLATPIDNERAYFWFSLAGVLKTDEAGHEEPESFAREIESEITDDKIIQIRAEIETWLADHPPVPVTPIPPIY